MAYLSKENIKSFLSQSHNVDMNYLPKSVDVTKMYSTQNKDILPINIVCIIPMAIYVLTFIDNVVNINVFTIADYF